MTEFKSGSVRANGVNFHYLEEGQGPLVLCMHGFPDHAYSFSYLLPELANSGFRGVAPFMRGYAPTEVPKDGRYQTAVLAQDVLALIDALGDGKAAVVGHDWGASAAYGAAILGPEKVTKLVTIASSHSGADEIYNFDYLRGTWHSYYFQMLYAGETVAYNNFTFIEDWWRNASPEWDIPKDVLEKVKETFGKPGVVEAALNYYRHSLNSDLTDPKLGDSQRKIDSSPVTVSTLALHGTRDRPRRLECFEKMDSFFTGGLDKVVIPGTGHFLHQERPKEANLKILEFLTHER